MVGGSAGSKSRLPKAAGAEVSVQRRNEKLHAVVARSTFWSQNAEKLSFSEHFLKSHKNGTPLWREAHFEGNMLKHCHYRSTDCICTFEKWHAVVPRSTFQSCTVEKRHAVVGRSTFASQNAKKKLTCSEHFLMFRSRKFVRRCSEKHMCKAKCTKHERFGALFEGLDVSNLN